MTQPHKNKEIKHDELSDADLDNVSGGVLCTNENVVVIKPVAPITNSFGGEDWGVVKPK
jgi:hypothetical protein